MKTTFYGQASFAIERRAAKTYYLTRLFPLIPWQRTLILTV